MSRLWPPAHGWNRNKPTAQLPAVSLSSQLHTPSLQCLHRSKSRSLSPTNTTRPWPAAQNSHGPGSYEQERVTGLMGTQCTMSDAHSVPVRSASRLCGSKKKKNRCHWLCNMRPMPAKETWIQHKKMSQLNFKKDTVYTACNHM